MSALPTTEVPPQAEEICSIEALPPDQAARLSYLEVIIEKGLQTFVDVANALIEIHDKKLYRKTHSSFKEYCRDRWHLSRPYVYQIMDAGKAAGNVSAMADIPPPDSERVARELVGLTEEQQKIAWEEAYKTFPPSKDGKKKVTAKHLKETIRKLGFEKKGSKKGKKGSGKKGSGSNSHESPNKPEPVTISHDVPEPLSPGESWHDAAEPMPPGEPWHDRVEAVTQYILRKWDSFLDAFDAADKAQAKRIIFERLTAEEQEEFTRTGHHWGETGSSCPTGAENLYH